MRGWGEGGGSAWRQGGLQVQRDTSDWGHRVLCSGWDTTNLPGVFGKNVRRKRFLLVSANFSPAILADVEGRGKGWQDGKTGEMTLATHADFLGSYPHLLALWPWTYYCYLKKFFLEYSWFTMLVSVIQQSESVKHIHISIFFFRICSHIDHYGVLSRVSCAV